MKTVLTIIVIFIGSCSQINAQTLYPVLIKAHNRVNQYDYNRRCDFKESIDTPIKISKIEKMDLKIISDALLKVDFKYDNKNDTILVVAAYEDSLVGVGPYRLFAKSSKGTTQISRHFLEGLDFEYQEEEQYAGDYDESVLPLMYFGEVDSLRKFFWIMEQFFQAFVLEH